MTTPLICGTLVNNLNNVDVRESLLEFKKITNMTFNRKLRMIRADLYALLSISMCTNFVKSAEES